MSWGDCFSSLWHSASSTARDAAAAVATRAEEITDGAGAAVQQLAVEAEASAKNTAAGTARVMSTAASQAASAGQHFASEAEAIAKNTIAAAGASLKTAAKSAERQVADAAQWVGKEAANAAKTAENFAQAAVHDGTIATRWVAQKEVEFRNAVVAATAKLEKAAANKIAAVYAAAKHDFSVAVADIATATCAIENWALNIAAFGLSSVTTLPFISDAVRPLLGFWGSKPHNDGDPIGADCQKNSTGGMRPPGCRSTSLQKIVYVNGILTTYDQSKDEHGHYTGICGTMEAIAQATCAEVTGIYNATQGFGRDLDKSLDHIAKQGTTTAVDTVRELLVTAAQKHQPLTLFAHSDGGLLTQEAVAQAKAELMMDDNLTAAEAEQKLNVISISSFGTALLGWPKGPHYERFTNTADPVPPAIIGAQISYQDAAWSDSAAADKTYVFTSPHFNPLESHYMDTSYIPEFSRIKGAPHCACKGT